MTLAAEPRVRQGAGGVSNALVWLGLALLAITGAYLLLLSLNEGIATGHDFVQDYAAIGKITVGRNPYEPYNDVTLNLFGGRLHPKPLYSFHAPSSLPLLMWLVPFAWNGGYVGAFLAWACASFLGLWSICWLVLRVFRTQLPFVAGLLAALALLVLPAIRQNFEEGQLNVLVAAGMVGCWATRRQRWPVLAGILLGTAFSLKPIPGLFFLYYAWRRDWRLVISGAATVAVLSIIGVALAGWHGTWLWATVNYPSHANYWPGYPDNGSVRGFLTRLFGPSASDWPRTTFRVPWLTMPLWVLMSGGLTILAILAARTGLRSERTLMDGLPGLLSKLAPPPYPVDHPRGDIEIAVLSVLTLLVTPIVWPHYYVVLAMPVAIIAAYLVRLIIEGSVRPSVGPGLPDAPTYNPRKRVLPMLALLALGLASALLAATHYVEPYARNGGQQLFALLVIYAASLVALLWSARDQGRGSMPAAAR